MERKTLTTGRARRAMKMGSLASQVGSSYLWTSLRRPFLDTARYEQELLDIHLKNARRVVDGSKQLRGAFMKLVQMLSMREDLLPGEAIDILRTTQANVPPMDYRLISQQIRRELSKSPEQLFASFARPGPSRETQGWRGSRGQDPVSGCRRHRRAGPEEFETAAAHFPGDRGR